MEHNEDIPTHRLYVSLVSTENREPKVAVLLNKLVMKNKHFLFKNLPPKNVVLYQTL